MAGNHSQYQRISRSRLLFDGYGSLWLGKDHILLMKNVMAVENYRRWYFKDVHALVSRRTSARLIWNILMCSAGGLAGLGAAGLATLAIQETGGDRVALAVFASILGAVALFFFGAAIVNTLMGPTCTVFVQTPFGTESLSAPKRQATFEKVAARVRSAASALAVEPVANTPAAPESQG